MRYSSRRRARRSDLSGSLDNGRGRTPVNRAYHGRSDHQRVCYGLRLCTAELRPGSSYGCVSVCHLQYGSDNLGSVYVCSRHLCLGNRLYSREWHHRKLYCGIPPRFYPDTGHRRQPSGCGRYRSGRHRIHLSGLDVGYPPRPGYTRPQAAARLSV